MNSEQFEMREVHRTLLIRNRLYLLHNIRPTETLWSTLHAKQVLPSDMIEDIRTNKTMTSQVARLLDLLPARGPTAFDQFCEALLECDHGHVAEYLKTLEATDHFRTEIQPHCVDLSDNMMERLVTIFKRNTPTVQRFAERKFELMLGEQERDLRQREEDVRALENQNLMLSLEVTQLRTFINSCKETSENIVVEIQRDFLSKMFLREEKKHIENLKSQLQGIPAFDKISSFYTNMQTLLTYLEKHAGLQTKEKNETASDKKVNSRQAPSAQARSLHDKMLQLKNMLVELADGTATMSTIPGHTLRTELEKILNFLKIIIEDVWKIHDVFKSTMRQKRKLEGEVISLLHNFQEIRRLEREVKEKQAHISDLTKQGQVMKKKTKSHRKQLEQIYLNMEQRKIQLRELQGGLERQLNSADQRLHHMLILLPDMEDSDFTRSDTEVTSDAGSFSRLNTPDRLYSSSYRRPLSTKGVPPLSSVPITAIKKITDEPEVTKSSSDEQMKKQEDSAACEKSTDFKTDIKTKQNTATTNTSKGLLERRKAKQTILTRESTNVSRRLSRDSKATTKFDRSTSRVTVKLTGDQNTKKDQQKEDELDLDSWIENEKNKVGEIQQKLSQFKVVPTKDRTSEMESVRRDIDEKIDEITKKTAAPSPESAEKKTENDPSEKNVENSQIGRDQHPSSGNTPESAGSRSTSSSNKENSTPNFIKDKSTVASAEAAVNEDDKRDENLTSRRASRAAVRREFTAANMKVMSGYDLSAQDASTLKPGESQENWVPPKKRFGDREALKANRIELRLPSK